MKIRSEIDKHEDTYEEIPMIADILIKKLEANKLYKRDRELLIRAVLLIYEIRANQE